jgi:hypothetical protein
MGRPEGRALEHWLRAEAELAAEAAVVPKLIHWHLPISRHGRNSMARTLQDNSKRTLQKNSKVTRRTPYSKRHVSEASR